MSGRWAGHAPSPINLKPYQAVKFNKNRSNHTEGFNILLQWMRRRRKAEHRILSSELATSERGLSGTSLSPYPSTKKISKILWEVFTRGRRRGEKRLCSSKKQQNAANALSSEKREKRRDILFSLEELHLILAKLLLKLMKNMKMTMIVNLFHQFQGRRCMTPRKCKSK